MDFVVKKVSPVNRDTLPKSMFANRVGMMHESNGQHIGKAHYLHLFHTTIRQVVSEGIYKVPLSLQVVCWHPRRRKVVWG